MWGRFQFRFLHLVMAAMLGFVLAVAAVFASVVFSKFREMADANARERFASLTTQTVGSFEASLAAGSRFLGAQARLGAGKFVRNGRIDGQGPVLELMAAIETIPNIYGFYVALPSDEFLQVIGVRGDPKIIASLEAPPETFFALRHIERMGEQRVEHWRFLSQSRTELARRDNASSYFPSRRSWYSLALIAKAMVLTEPYLFQSTGRMGLTMAQQFPDGSGVVGADVSLDAVERLLAELALTANGSVLMLDQKNRIVAHRGEGARSQGLQFAPLAPLAEAKAAQLQPLKDLLEERTGVVTKTYRADDEDYLLTQFRFAPFAGAGFTVALLAPVTDFSGPIDAARQQVLLVTAIALVLLVPLALLGAGGIARSLRSLARSSERIKRFDFSHRPVLRASVVAEVNTLGEAQLVMHDSIQQRTAELQVEKDKLSKLVEAGLSLSREHDRQALLRNILTSGRDIAHAARGTLYLVTESRTLQFAMLTNDDPLPSFEMPLYDKDTGKANDHYVSVYAAVHNQTSVIDDVYQETRFDMAGTKAFSEKSGFRTISMLTVPLSPGGGEVIGVLQYLNALDPTTGEAIPFDPEIVGFVEALAAQSAVTLQNLQLLQAQKDLMDSMIKIVAGAIDAKSPYTGGHCERVPELALMLAEEATKVQSGSLAGFAFRSEDEWREFRIGAWLHDCGKVTTPEYVVDKASKLETIYNRIHEIRTRFEVLLRDAEIERLKAIAGGVDAEQANHRYELRQTELLDDFAFIAEANLGGEFLAAERIERIRRIGAQTWMRHFDNRLGLSHEELRRYEDESMVVLPVEEPLLADKPHHVVRRGPQAEIDPAGYHDFKVTVPEHLYNFGELYNLSIERGTLTDEERFKINEHIIQTIVMLSSMPFPKTMRRVPEYAGTHHETLIGTGYPKRLGAQELSVPSRIMAIADIFEALTASDRPYKKAKTLSESIKILSHFKRNQHIDAELFDLFLTSGTYLRYAQRYLKAEQIDEVDVAQYLG